MDAGDNEQEDRRNPDFTCLFVGGFLNHNTLHFDTECFLICLVNFVSLYELFVIDIKCTYCKKNIKFLLTRFTSLILLVAGH